MLNTSQCEAEVVDTIENYGTHSVIFFNSGMYTVLEAKAINGFPYIEECEFVPEEIQAKIERHQTPQLEDFSWSEV